MKAALILGSESDLPYAEKAVSFFKKFGIKYEARVLSAHRTPDATADFARSAREEGFGVLIAFAGMAAHLAGALASHTTLPVIAVPCAGGNSAAGGLDALLSSVQMPSGVPVATVAINGGANAAILAAEILALSDAGLAAKLLDYKKELQNAAHTLPPI